MYGWKILRSVTPLVGNLSHDFRYFFARWSSLSKWVWWIVWTERWNLRDGSRYLEYIAVLYSPLTWHLSRLDSFVFSNSSKRIKLSAAVFLNVIVEPRNLNGSSSRDFVWTCLGLFPSVKSHSENVLFVGFPLVMERDRHLLGFNTSPRDWHFSWMSSCSW